MLALLSLIMDAFRIGYFVGYHSCISAVLGVYPIVHALHTISQVRGHIYSKQLTENALRTLRANVL